MAPPSRRCETARSLEKPRSWPSSPAMQLFGQPPRSMRLRFLAKLFTNCLDICRVYGKRCRRLQEGERFLSKRLRREHSERNLPDKSCVTLHVHTEVEDRQCYRSSSSTTVSLRFR